MKIFFILLLSISFIYADNYTITTQTNSYTLDLNPSDVVLTFKHNSTTNEDELWIYDKLTNSLESKYDLNNISPGTVITNPYTLDKYLILYDNINHKNMIKKIN